MTAYFAPAGRLLTDVHTAAEPMPDGTGVTTCGLVMDAADLWQAMELRPADRVCRGCAGLPEDEQGELL